MSGILEGCRDRGQGTPVVRIARLRGASAESFTPVLEDFGRAPEDEVGGGARQQKDRPRDDASYGQSDHRPGRVGETGEFEGGQAGTGEQGTGHEASTGVFHMGKIGCCLVVFRAAYRGSHGSQRMLFFIFHGTT